MYQPGTILTRKKPFEGNLEPYNEVRVIGQCPTQTGVRDSEWTGGAGDQIDITPTSFGTVVTKAFGELQRDYSVASIPEQEIEEQPKRKPYEQPPTPEEQFKAEASTSGRKKSTRREQTPFA